MACDGLTHQVHYMEGEVNKMLVDDKGTILLCAFGLPPRSHPDDALRAVRTALLLADLLGGDVTSADLLGGDVTSEKDGDLLGGDVTSEKDGIPLTSSVEAEGAAPPPPPPKSAELVRRIVAALSEKPPFDALDEAQKHSLADAMMPLEAKAQDQLLNEGDEGQHCYLLDRGELCVKVKGVEKDRIRVSDKVLPTIFGEMALTYDVPRTATIEVVSDTASLFRLDRLAFRRALQPDDIWRRPIACIGIGTGRIFCGTVGTLERREFTTMGDAVNVAARCMQIASALNAPSRVICDEPTMSHTRANIHYNPLPPIKLKGKAAQMALYSPVAELEDHSNAQFLISRMGRDAEVNQLRGLLSNLLVYHGGSGHLMLIGAKGSGKSALVAALAEFGAKASLHVIRTEIRDHAAQLRAHRRTERITATMTKFAGHGDPIMRATTERHGERQLSVLGRAQTGTMLLPNKELLPPLPNMNDEAVPEPTRSKTMPSHMRQSTEPLTHPPLSKDEIIRGHDLSVIRGHQGSEREPAAKSLTTSLGVAVKAAHFGMTIVEPIRARSCSEQTVRQMLPELAELFTQLVALGASAHELSTAEFVRDALLASAPLQPTEPSLRVLLSELISEPIHVPTGTSREDRVPVGSIPDQFALSLLPDLDSAAPRVHLDRNGQCEAVLAVVLSLMRKLTLARSAPCAASYTSHRLLLILRLDVDGETDSPIWTWRLAHRISSAIISDGLPVILCIVTTPTSALPDGGADPEDEQLQTEGRPFAMEQATILSAIKSAAVHSDTFLKLEPLTKVAQQAYVLQVLRAKYSYSGTLDGIPSGLLDFVFARSGGKPVFIETVRQSATDCH